jgi:hypothetical protein
MGVGVNTGVAVGVGIGVLVLQPAGPALLGGDHVFCTRSDGGPGCRPDLGGVVLPAVVPSPIWPSKLEPQAQRVPGRGVGVAVGVGVGLGVAVGGTRVGVGVGVAVDVAVGVGV